MTVVSDSSLGLSSRPHLALRLPVTAHRPARPSRALRLTGVAAFVAVSVAIVRWSVAAFGPLGWFAIWLPLMVGTATVLCTAISGNTRRGPAPRLTFLDSPTVGRGAAAGLPCVVVASTGAGAGNGVELDPRPVSVDFYTDDAVTVRRNGVTLWRAPHHLIQAVDVTGGLDRHPAEHPGDPVESADLPDMYVAIRTAQDALTLRPASGSTARLDVVVHDLRVDRMPAPTVSA